MGKTTHTPTPLSTSAIKKRLGLCELVIAENAQRAAETAWGADWVKRLVEAATRVANRGSCDPEPNGSSWVAQDELVRFIISADGQSITRIDVLDHTVETVRSRIAAGEFAVSDRFTESMHSQLGTDAEAVLTVAARAAAQDGILMWRTDAGVHGGWRLAKSGDIFFFSRSAETLVNARLSALRNDDRKLTVEEMIDVLVDSTPRPAKRLQSKFPRAWGPLSANDRYEELLTDIVEHGEVREHGDNAFEGVSELGTALFSIDGQVCVGVRLNVQGDAHTIMQAMGAKELPAHPDISGKSKRWGVDKTGALVDIARVVAANGTIERCSTHWIAQHLNVIVDIDTTGSYITNVIVRSADGGEDDSRRLAAERIAAGMFVCYPGTEHQLPDGWEKAVTPDRLTSVGGGWMVDVGDVTVHVDQSGTSIRRIDVK